MIFKGVHHGSTQMFFILIIPCVDYSPWSLVFNFGWCGEPTIERYFDNLTLRSILLWSNATVIMVMLVVWPISGEITEKQIPQQTYNKKGPQQESYS